MKKEKGNAIALLPIGVFLILYLGLGILFEYVMKIPMGFYNVPIVVAFLAAILVACLQNRKVDFDKKLELMVQALFGIVVSVPCVIGCFMITNIIGYSKILNLVLFGKR